MENRLKELHHGLELDRTSCERFTANQFRVLLTAAACILFQTLQAQRLLKLAAWVERSVRRIVLHLPTSSPWLSTWRQLAVAVGAAPA